MRFMWDAEPFKLHLLSHEFQVQDTNMIKLNLLEMFTPLRFLSIIKGSANGEDPFWDE
jgi:hypothetical protein